MRNRYKKMMDSFVVSEELKKQTAERMRQQGKSRTKRPLYHFAPAAAVICLVLAGAMVLPRMFGDALVEEQQTSGAVGPGATSSVWVSQPSAEEQLADHGELPAFQPDTSDLSDEEILLYNAVQTYYQSQFSDGVTIVTPQYYGSFTDTNGNLTMIATVLIENYQLSGTTLNGVSGSLLPIAVTWNTDSTKPWESRFSGFYLTEAKDGSEWESSIRAFCQGNDHFADLLIDNYSGELFTEQRTRNLEWYVRTNSQLITSVVPPGEEAYDFSGVDGFASTGKGTSSYIASSESKEVSSLMQCKVNSAEVACVRIMDQEKNTRVITDRDEIDRLVKLLSAVKFERTGMSDLAESPAFTILLEDGKGHALWSAGLLDEFRVLSDADWIYTAVNGSVDLTYVSNIFYFNK